MDRAISQKHKNQRQRKMLLLAIGGLLAVSGAIYLLRQGISTSIDGNRLLIASAELGTVSHTLTTSGLVQPAFEEVITSPIQATIQKVLLPIGAEVRANQSIMALDKSFAQLDYQRQQQELRLKANSVKKLRLELEKSYFTLQISDSTQALTIAQLKAEWEDARRLEKIGGGTKEEISLIETKLKIAQLNKRKLEYDLSIEKQQTEASIEDLKIQYNIQANSLQSIKAKLDRADIYASRPGILTWANANIGTNIQAGEVLARVADLSHYKVVGTCSDMFMDRLQRGMRVIVQLNTEVRTEGTIANILPSVENNIMTFEVELDQGDHKLLRPDMRVEVFVVTASKSQVVRVANGPAFKGGQQQTVFVIEDGTAVRREVKVGLSSFEYVEIEGNISPGEQVIISNMDRYASRTEIKID
ncbi:MAG: HlyD family efflux transporter periplasmic adaptor subunit [Bacteroidota bacterium]